MKKFHVLTLGCCKNVVDSEYLIAGLVESEFEHVENIDEAEIAIINTCGFVGDAKKESLSAILEASGLKSVGRLKKLIVAGCLSQRYMADLKRQIPDVDFFAGVSSQTRIIDYLTGNGANCSLSTRKLLTPSHYAYLKIAEGCDRQCSFCAIPAIRGRYTSRPADEILAEARSLVDGGVKELIVIAQDTTFYGRDTNGKPQLAALLESLATKSGAEWIRLLYTYPADFPEDVLSVIADQRSICKYIDLPLQHVSDRLLRSMRRGTTRKKIEELIVKIRQSIPGVAIRSTFIVGYPGETERDYSSLLEFITDYRLERVGCFVYSHEDGTDAYKLSDSVPEKIKQERLARLMAAQQEISLDRNLTMIGKTIKVIVDEGKDGKYYCRSDHDAPEVDNGVIVESAVRLKQGNFYEIEVIRAEEYDLIATHSV